MSNGLTMHLDEDLALLSTDEGRTWTLDEDEAELLRRVASNKSGEEQTQTTSSLAAATLAEARQVKPRPASEPVPAVITVSGPEIALGPLARRIEVAFSDAIGGRRSVRRFSTLRLEDLATVLVATSRVQSWHDSEDGYQMTARPTPSAGARHPCELEVIVADVNGVAPGLWHFDPARCKLVYRHNDDRIVSAAVGGVQAAAALSGMPPATIFLVAHMRRTLARYPAGTTLVWRDIGVLLGFLHLTAAAAGLASCITGTGGVLEFDATAHCADVGAVALGRPAAISAS